MAEHLVGRPVPGSARDDYDLCRWRDIFERFDAMCDEIDMLRAQSDRNALAYIEAANPGIDMDEVRRVRTGGRP